VIDKRALDHALYARAEKHATGQAIQTAANLLKIYFIEHADQPKFMARILIVDDNPEMRASLEETLTLAGHEALFASDGKQCLLMLRHAAPDLILLDMLMPEMDGVEVLRQLHATASPRIIAMSGAKDWDVLHVAEQMGASKILTKPFTGTELLGAVEAVLART